MEVYCEKLACAFNYEGTCNKDILELNHLGNCEEVEEKFNYVEELDKEND